MRIRILPLVILTSFTLVVVKAVDFAIDKETGVINALAQDETPASTEETAIEEEPAGEAPPTLSPNYSGSGPQQLDVTNLSDMEKNLLENLSKRRQELEKWSESIAMKENILNATEKKINHKLEQLESLKIEVSKLLKEYMEKEDTKIQRLVKIYENMKPQDAAEIFSTMDKKVVLEVIGNMKEAKAAKILAKMNPTMADQLTEELARQRRISPNEQ